jgi:hypothetical protein
MGDETLTIQNLNKMTPATELEFWTIYSEQLANKDEPPAARI